MDNATIEAVEKLIEQMREGNVRALSRLMTLVETRPELVPVIMSRVYTKRTPARRVGLSGPPGAGKSTLMGNLIQAGVKRGHRVGVLCIDPTSPISGGALLGDRIRMTEAFSLKNVFIRSVASGRSLGGLSEATKYHTILLEAFGMDLILIETVGLGQVGYDIRNVAESLVLVLVPESGDTVQILKSGIIELADIVVVNKADRDGADDIARSLVYTFEKPRDGWQIPVIKSKARYDEGTDEICSALDDHIKYLQDGDKLGAWRDPRNDLREAVEFNFQRLLREGLFESMPEAVEAAANVEAGKEDPYSASMKLINILIKGDPQRRNDQDDRREKSPGNTA